MGDNIGGMNFHLKRLKSLIKRELDYVYIVDIYGINEIGKITMVMVGTWRKHLRCFLFDLTS